MKKSLSVELFNLIKAKKLVKMQTLRNLSERLGYIDSNCERRLRELRQKGLISQIYGVKDGTRFVEYYKLI